MADFTTPITLLEAARTGQLSALDAMLFETFLASRTQRPDQMINFWDVFPFADNPGKLTLEYQRELALPTITPRALNETVTRSVGSTETVKESLKIYPAEYIIDEVLKRTDAGARTLATQASMHAKAIMQLVQNHVFKGDETSSANQMTGLQARITGDQLISEGSTSGGDPLQVINLRDLIDRCYGDGVKILAMGKGMARRMDAAVGLSGIGAAIREGQTAWGMKAMMFDGIPIIPVADFEGKDNVLGFTEAGAGGGTTATSIYCLHLGPNDVHGLRNGGLFDHNVEQSSVDPGFIGRLTFLVQLIIRRTVSAGRLFGISDAAVIA